MDDTFHRAAIPEPVTVLGRRLKPYSLGHQILLERVRSPILAGSAFTFGDLLVAVSICSRDFNGAVKWLEDGGTASLKWWGFKVWLGIHLGTANLARALQTFRTYLRNGSLCPTPLYDTNARVKRLEVPLAALALQSLVKGGFSLSDAYNVNYGLALWLYCIACATDGDAEIVGEEWRKEVNELQLTPQTEIDRWVELHKRATRRN